MPLKKVRRMFFCKLPHDTRVANRRVTAVSKLFRNVPFLTSLEMSLFLFFVFVLVLVLVVGLARSEALRSP